MTDLVPMAVPGDAAVSRLLALRSLHQLYLRGAQLSAAAVRRLSAAGIIIESPP